MHCNGRISSLRLDLGGFPPETQAAGSSVKVPLILLERIILEGDFTEQKAQANSLSIHFPHFCHLIVSLAQTLLKLPVVLHHMVTICFLHYSLKGIIASLYKTYKTEKKQ